MKLLPRFRFFRLLNLPMAPGDALAEAAVGIKSRIHFNQYYLPPMLKKGLVVRTDPKHPNSPHQRYRLA